MARDKMRKKLTDEEFNAISTLTRRSHLNSEFDIYSKNRRKDYFWDFDANKKMSLKRGLEETYDGIFSLKAEDLTDEECKIILDLFEEFGVFERFQTTRAEAEVTLLKEVI